VWPEIGKKDKEDRKGRTAVWVVEQRAAGGVCIIMLMLLPQSPVPTLLGVHEEVRRRGSTGQGNFSASCDRREFSSDQNLGRLDLLDSCHA